MSKIQNALDECIDRLRKGESKQECLSRFPEFAASLESLLDAVAKVDSISVVEPNPILKARIRCHVMESAPQMSGGWQRAIWLGWRWNKALVTGIAAVLVLLIAGSGTVAASASSLPGQPLYGVKTTVERAQLALARSDIGKAKLLASFAERRVEEIGRLAESGDNDGIELASISLARQLTSIGDTLGLQSESPEERVSEEETPSSSDPGAIENQDRLLKPAPGPKSLAAPARTPNAAAKPPSSAGFGSKAVQQPAVDRAVMRKELAAAKNAAEVRTALRKAAIEHQVKLEKLLDKATEKTRPAIRRALLSLQRGYRAAAGDGNAPSK